MGRALPKLGAVVLCLDGEFATHGILDVADGGVEVVSGESAHRGDGYQRSLVDGGELANAIGVSQKQVTEKVESSE